MSELDDLRRRVDALEAWVVAATGADDPTLDLRRLRYDNARQRPEMERRVKQQLDARTKQRTERSPTFDGTNGAELRNWASGRCSLPDDSGGLRLIWRGEDHGLLAPGNWIEVDPDTGRLTIGRRRTLDLTDVYREVVNESS